MEKNAQHTPTPWTNPTDGGVKAPAERTMLRSGREVPFRVCTMQDGDLETVRANAAFIVRACNAHNELITLLTDAHRALGGAHIPGLPSKIRAALSKAGA